MKENLSAHEEAESTLATTSDYLFHLQCNEASAASNLTDVLGARTMTHTASPTVQPSAAQNNATSGARGFNGSTQYAGRAAADGDQTIFQEGNEGWGFGAWVRPSSLAANGTVVELGEWASPETSATNVQMAVSVRTDGSFRLDWEEATGTGRNNSSPASLLAASTWSHIGVRITPDPVNLGRMQIDFFHNGALVSRTSDRPWPTGGSSARWIVGASRDLGTAVGTPGSFFSGRLDDVIVTKFPPDVAWFRTQYARGRRDWSKRVAGSGTAPVGGGNHWSTHVRVLVNTAGPSNFSTSKFSTLGKVDLDWVDLTSVRVGTDDVRVDFLASPVEWSDTIDDLVATARFTLRRAWHFFNMSPFVGAAGYDAHNPLSSGDEHLLTPMRRVRIETAICPPTMPRDLVPSWAWEVQFDGFIRAVDVNRDGVTVTAADLGVALLDVFIEPSKDGTDRTYGSSAGTAVEGELTELIDDNDPAHYDVISIDDNGAGNAIVVTVAQSGAGVPNGRGKITGLSVGDFVRISGTVNFNTPAGTYDTIASVSTSAFTLARTTAGAFAAETVGALDAALVNGYKGEDLTGRVRLWVPSSPSWSVYEWNEPASKSVLQALDDIVSQIGWRVRFRWHETRQQFRLALYDPAVFPDSATGLRADQHNYTASPLLTMRRMSQNVDDTRNVWAVEWYEEANKDPRGNRIVALAGSRNLTSIRKNGRRYARVNVGTDSLINTATEASKLAVAGTYDMGEPIADAEVETLFDDVVQIGDALILVSEKASDGQAPQFFDADTLEGSITAVSHRIDNGAARTVIGVRRISGFLDNPVARAARYSEVVAQVGSLPGRGLSPPKTPAAPTASALGAINGVRHARVRWTYPGGDLNAAWLEMEVHFGTTSNFTPTTSTLTTFGGVVRGTTAIFGGFTAGTTYYCRIVSVDRMGNRSAVSPQASFVA